MQLATQDPCSLPLIAKGRLEKGHLAGKVAVVTGAGRGIGFEAARSLAWLGALVVVAEIDEKTGLPSSQKISEEMGKESAVFVRTDVGDEESVRRLAQSVLDPYGKVDIVLNNACLVRIGAVKDKPIEDWDLGYRVNLRGPVLLARAFLHGMIERRSGVFVCVSSSGAAPFMGPYEVFKTAQGELANTIDAELEGTGVYAFTIGPGLVRTEGSLEGIRQIAPLYGKTSEEFYQMSSAALISVEAAGAGFAAAIALAEHFHGQEISSMAALAAAQINDEPPKNEQDAKVPKADLTNKIAACREAYLALGQQNAEWKKYSVFMRQWMFRDFKKNAGMPIEEWLNKLQLIQKSLEAGSLSALREALPSLERLNSFYDHLLEQQRGFQKDPAKLKEGEAAIESWRAPVKKLVELTAK